MSLLKHIEDSVAAEAQKVAAAWKSTVAPWLKYFLNDLVHHEVETLKPFADQFVGQEAGILVNAIATGNTAEFFAKTGELGLKTLSVAKTAGLQVLETSAQAAVLAAVAAHPGVKAAYTAQAATKPAS